MSWSENWDSADTLEEALEKFKATKHWCAFNPQREYRLVKVTSEILDSCLLGAGESSGGDFSQK